VIRVKRTYEPPAREDGRRILVERLWPRGMKKEALAIDAWLKEVAPSTVLRKWFAHEVERWPEFRRRYEAELDANPDAWAPLLAEAKKGTVTLLFSAHDTLHNGAIVLRDYLAKRTSRAQSVRKTSARRAPSPRKVPSRRKAPSTPRATSSRKATRARKATGTDRGTSSE
jgi:uncharacterized protein YeaO (DUF488 family)